MTVVVVAAAAAVEVLVEAEKLSMMALTTVALPTPLSPTTSTRFGNAVKSVAAVVAVVVVAVPAVVVVASSVCDAMMFVCSAVLGLCVRNRSALADVVSLRYTSCTRETWTCSLLLSTFCME